MKTKQIVSALILATFLVGPAVAFAITEEECLEENGQYADGKCYVAKYTNIGDIQNLINEIGRYIFAALIAVAAIFLTVAGFFFVTAGGNPETLKTARQMLINSLIGIAVALAARGLISIIASLLTEEVK